MISGITAAVVVNKQFLHTLFIPVCKLMTNNADNELWLLATALLECIK